MHRPIPIALFVLALLNALVPAAELNQSEAISSAKPTICLVGDSTVTDSAGWGKGFAASLADGVECVNFAQGGRSSKSFRDEGHWNKALASKADWVLIQFGHNDQPGKGPARETDPKTTFPANLKRYAEEARAAGMKPVIVTSLVRRNFSPDGKIKSNLAEYADAAKRAAADAGVPLIDLHALSIEECNRLGPEGSKAISPINESGEKKGQVDSTHLNAEGSELFGAIVAKELARVLPELAPAIKVPAAATRAAQRAQKASASEAPAAAAVTIVLAGDSTVTDNAGWGLGFAALLKDDVKLINFSRGGRSSRTFYDEGRWKQCLEARPDYVLIQFGHNDEPGTDRSTNLQTEFPVNMRRYVTEARAGGVKPILVTPLVRRQFKEDGKIQSSLAKHAQAVRDIAKELDVPLIELHDRSKAVCDALGKGACISLLSTTKPNGDFDGTHLAPAGGLLMGAIVADELKRVAPDLTAHLRAVPKSSETPATRPSTSPATTRT